MNTSKNSDLSNQYLLDTSYAEYIKNHLSEFYPKTLLKLNIESKLEQFIIEVADMAAHEYVLQFDSLDNSTLEKRNTNHIIAKEHANALIVHLINQKLA